MVGGGGGGGGGGNTSGKELDCFKFHKTCLSEGGSYIYFL